VGIRHRLVLYPHLETLGLAHVKKIPPELTYDKAKDHIDLETVKAVITARSW